MKSENIMIMRNVDDYIEMPLINDMIETRKEDVMKLLLYLLRDTGARISEVLAVKVKDINFERKEIRLLNLKRKAGKRDIKTNPVTDDCINFLRYWVEKNRLDSESKIFFKRCGITNRVIAWKKIKELGEEYGIDIHPHTFRHSLAKFLVENGVPLPQVQQILGHSDIVTTSFYLRFSSSAVRLSYDEAMKKI